MCVSPNTNITTTNFVIEGDAARGEIYCLVFHTFAGPKHDIDVVIGGRYLDWYNPTRRPLEVHATHHRGGLVLPKRPVPQVNFGHPSTRGSLRGKPGQADPSIGFFTSGA